MASSTRGSETPRDSIWVVTMLNRREWYGSVGGVISCASLLSPMAHTGPEQANRVARPRSVALSCVRGISLKTTVVPGSTQCQPRRRLRVSAGLAALVLIVTACGPGARSESDTLASFFAAVQERDLDGLYCMMAGAAEAEELGATDADRRAAFESWALEHYAAYEEGRDRGRVELDEQGLTLVKLFSLGRGTFVTHGFLRAAGPDSALVESRVRFGYAHIDLSRFSPGTTFYVCGVPVGRVHPIRVPTRSREVTVDVLEGVAIEWSLLRAPATETCPGGWKVAAARPVAGSEVAVEVTWIF